MMFLPSGRSNSNVNALQSNAHLNTAEPHILSKTSSPHQLGLNALSANRKTENNRDTQHNQKTSPLSAASPSASSLTGTEEVEVASSNVTQQQQIKTLSTSTGSHSDGGNGCDTVSVAAENSRYISILHPSFLESRTMTTTSADGTASVLGTAGNWEEFDRHLQTLQEKLKNGWTVHAGREGRIYYCNHLTQTSGWLPSCEDWSKTEDLPYGWERAVDSKGRSYFINHLNKSSTYEAPETVRWDDNPPEPRVVVLQRSPKMGFGFVAGSERPVIVRFVTEDGPSTDKLLPGDHILAVNGEDVKSAPRDHVIQLVRACESQVTLLVCQPAHNIIPGRKSTLLSASKRAKLRTRPSRVRFAESVCVNGAPLFPPSAFSLGDICVPPMANVLKVFLENGQTKSFKYDTTTTVQDVVTSLLDKLCLTTGQIFSLVLEHVKSLKRNKLTLLDPEESLARIAARPGAHKLRCLFRVTFVPISASNLAQKDLNALDYLYMQSCNDVTQERFAPELQPEVALRLAALHMHQHALANNVSPVKLTVKIVEREFGLERFVPASLFDAMKRKELRRLISHFLKLNAEMTGSSTKVLTQLQAKLHYLDIIAGLPSYGAKCFSTNQREGVERVLLVSPRFGLSQISSTRNSMPQPISSIEDFSHVVVNREDDVTCSVSVFMHGDRAFKFCMEDRDACEFSLVLAGYYRLLTDKELPVQRDREPLDEDHAPLYLSQHTVLPAAWSYLPPFHNRPHSMNFLTLPPYHPQDVQPPQTHEAMGESKMLICDRNMNSANVANSNHKPKKLHILSTTTTDLDMHSVMATELLEEAKDSGLSDSSGGGSSNYCERQNTFVEARSEEVLRRVQEMQKLVESSEQYLSEQGEYLPDLERPPRKNENLRPTTEGLTVNTSGMIEFDSDCESLNSSKISSSAEDTPQPGALKHSDSLVLLSEAINQDLSGITKGLNSIGGSQPELALHRSNLSATSSPRADHKMNGLSQLLSNLQALSTDFSQSESDSESVNSPASSPTTRRPSSILQTAGERTNRHKNVAYRSSFGLHSPDGSNFGPETKDYNLKEYLKQLKELSNVGNDSHDMADMAAKKLSEIYGFEIREDTFIETDADLIDLRAIPPPQTPDELDALSLLNAPPQGFDDSFGSGNVTTKVDETGDLDQFLAKVVVAPPPTLKAKPAKELTPEEIMSFIIPPPPNSDSIEISKKQENPNPRIQDHENLYSNAITEKREIFNRKLREAEKEVKYTSNKMHATNDGRTIEYATVERRGKFSCCPKSKKENSTDQTDYGAGMSPNDLMLPPRQHQNVESTPPARPPKTTEILQRFSPKKHIQSQVSTEDSRNLLLKDLEISPAPPQLPPRMSPTSRPSGQPGPALSQAVSVAPKKPPLPPISSRPILRNNNNAVSPTYSSLSIAKINAKPITTTSHQLPSSPATPASSPQPPPIQPRTYHKNSTSYSTNGHHYRSNNDCPSTFCPQNALSDKAQQSLHICSPQLTRKLYSPIIVPPNKPILHQSDKLIMKNGHIIDGDALLAKTDVAMAGLLIKLDQVASQCSAAQAAGGGANIDEEKFQRARNELTEQTLVLVTASKYLVVAMSDTSLSNLPEHLTSCLTAIRRITELTQEITRHTSAPLQTRNIVLKVHDVASSFRELVGVEIGPSGAGQLALQAECLANVLATLLRSLRVFSP